MWEDPSGVSATDLRWDGDEDEVTPLIFYVLQSH
jgi:hypothetical protein